MPDSKLFPYFGGKRLTVSLPRKRSCTWTLPWRTMCGAGRLGGSPSTGTY